jgi:hypothetical protein
LSGWSGYVSSRLRTGFKSSICGCYPRVASQCMGTVTERNARRLPEPARGARRCTHWPHSRRVALADANVIFSAPPGAPALRDVSQTATMPEEPPPRQTQIPATSTHHPRTHTSHRPPRWPHQPPPTLPRRAPTAPHARTPAAATLATLPPSTPRPPSTHQQATRSPAPRSSPTPPPRPPTTRPPAASAHSPPPGRLPPRRLTTLGACRPGRHTAWAPTTPAARGGCATPQRPHSTAPRPPMLKATGRPNHRQSLTLHAKGTAYDPNCPIRAHQTHAMSSATPQS